MKIRESGMPDEEYWRQFYDPPGILRLLELTPACRDAVEFGCGYGTFAIPAARIVSGTLHALDIEPEMIAVTRRKAEEAGLTNLVTSLRDFMAEGSGLPDSSMDYAMLFNILHAEHPLALLAEARRVLTPQGRLAIIHWRPDPTTPRGPALEIRPKPDDCLRWGEQAGMRPSTAGILELPPYHYGILMKKV